MIGKVMDGVQESGEWREREKQGGLEGTYAAKDVWLHFCKYTQILLTCTL